MPESQLPPCVGLVATSRMVPVAAPLLDTRVIS